jgi:uncharacterized repeat protein (TIGR01451 family)
MKSKHIATYLFFVLCSLFIAAGQVHADTCTTQYGGTTTCVPTDLTVNKEVRNPINNVFVENLGTGDKLFKTGDEVTYRLTIKNASGETFNPVTVHDVLPPYLTFVAGPGTYNKDNRTLTFTLENLIAGETRQVEILARVVDLPNDKSVFCVENKADVSALNRYDDDTAQVCLGTNVLGSTLPVAGFDDFALLLPAVGVALSGIVMLKGKKRS